MRAREWDVLVIGGGATGAGAARDCAMRGLRTALVEQAGAAHGTTGRYHGLLHSGARYAVKDPEAARACARENQVLRRILPHAIEDTGGMFVTLPGDDETYPDAFAAACRAAGVPCEEISPRAALRREPRLNPAVGRAFLVPDAAADSFAATRANLDAARAYGAEVLAYHEALDLIRDRDHVVGARVLNRFRGDRYEVRAAVTINAAGPWAGRVASMAGIRIDVALGKGTMVALSHRLTDTVLNRCQAPGDGDILVPIRTVCVAGTTDYRVSDPERYAIEPWEVAFLLEEGDKLVPGLSRARVLRAWAGVRPLYAEAGGNTRDLSRAHALIDHESRDGVRGLITITGGKWTTYRLMAEAATDAACRFLDRGCPCRTHVEPMPGMDDGRYFAPGAPLARAEGSISIAPPSEIVCECELVTAADVAASLDAGARTLDDVRRDTRLGMGPCQGGFCMFRAAGLRHAHADAAPARRTDAERRAEPDALAEDAARTADSAVALVDFVAERWKGLRPILWGVQLQQARYDEVILHGLVFVDGLATHGRGSPMSEFYARGGEFRPTEIARVEDRADRDGECGA